MIDVTVKTIGKNNYFITLAEDFSLLKDKLDSVNLSDGANKICIISDSNVWPLYGEEVKNILPGFVNDIVEVIIEPGEISKKLENLEQCYSVLKDNEFNRNDIIVALGGGVVCDYAGYAAATFKRGVRYIMIPTSLSAMADCTVGGLAELDFDGYKNLMGANIFPNYVYCNIGCLNTLEPAFFYSGFAVVMRTAVVKSSSVYEWLIDKLYEISDKDVLTLTDMIEQNINLKKIYAEKDPLGEGDQLLFGLGNNIGLALYKAKEDSMSYGECLALGIICAAHISMKREMLSLDEYLEIRDMFVPFNLPITVEDINIDEIADSALVYDNFVLLKKIGKAVIDKNVTKEEITAALDEIKFSDDDYVVE